MPTSMKRGVPCYMKLSVHHVAGAKREHLSITPILFQSRGTDIKLHGSIDFIRFKVQRQLDPFAYANRTIRRNANFEPVIGNVILWLVG